MKQLNIKNLGLCALILTINACSLPQAISYNVSHSLGNSSPSVAPSITHEKRKFGNPYSEENEHGNHVWYTPLRSSEGYKETGIASWYGKKFHANKTSNGEKYNMYAYTAAHKTLPLPTYVRVTNNDNGKSIIVRVNDRGPFYKDRIIDMSYAGAKALGFDTKGTAHVTVEAISVHGGDVKRSGFTNKNRPVSTNNYKPAYQRTYNNNNSYKPAVKYNNQNSFTYRIANRNKPSNVNSTANNKPITNMANSKSLTSIANTQYFVQLGSFTDINNARRMYYAAKKINSNAKITSNTINNRIYYRVIIDNAKTAQHAESILNNIQQNGFNNAIIAKTNK